MIYFVMFEGFPTRYVVYAESAADAMMTAALHWTNINGGKVPAIHVSPQEYEGERMVAIN